MHGTVGTTCESGKQTGRPARPVRYQIPRHFPIEAVGAAPSKYLPCLPRDTTGHGGHRSARVKRLLGLLRCCHQGGPWQAKLEPRASVALIHTQGMQMASRLVMEEILGSSESGPGDALIIIILKNPHCHNIAFILQGLLHHKGEEVHSLQVVGLGLGPRSQQVRRQPRRSPTEPQRDQGSWGRVWRKDGAAGRW